MTESRAALEEFSRARYQTARLTESDVLCRVLGRYMIYADPEDVRIVPHLCLDGFWESWITVAAARLIRPGWHCVDVGANHGYYTVLMADAAGEGGRVLAVEPNPQLCERLGRSLEVNGLVGRTTVLQRAAADADGAALTLAVPRRHASDATVCRGATADEDAFAVEAVTLDRATADWPRVDFVKIDAEGAEALIWRGMRGLLRRHPGVAVLLELFCSRHEDPRAFLREIQSEGFPLRHVGYDAGIADVTEEEILRGRADAEWMLFLRRD
ncbi:MAG: FkbM family methyltransferase [Acidobacteria bacterium]|nr:FkbM family methyltransferase [Acidobacteriota bacterium]